MKLNGAQLARMIDSTDVATLATKQDVDEMISQAKDFHFYAIIIIFFCYPFHKIIKFYFFYCSIIIV